MCIKCLNAYKLYKVARKYINDLPYSLTEFLTELFSCSFEQDFNFWHKECILGTCKNSRRVDDKSGTSVDRGAGGILTI